MTASSPLILRLLLVIAGIVCLAASWRTGSLAVAAWLASEPTIDRVITALRYTPTSSALHVLLGTATAVSKPELSQAEFARALELNPRNAEAAINLALEAEARGDTRSAQSLLDTSTRVSRRFRPLWTQAGFQYRRGDETAFWKWARAAANVEYAAVAPVFTLSARTGATPSAILARLRPGNPDALAHFVSFALETNDAAAVASAATRLAAFRRLEDVSLLLAACERLIDAGAAEAAVSTWNAIVRAGSTPLFAIDPSTGASFANPGCRRGPMRAFDWRIPDASGVAVARASPDGGFRIDLSGTQPESVRLLEKTIAVLPSTAYELRVIHGELPEALPGLRWRMLEVPSGADLAPATPPLTAAAEHTLSFRTGPTSRLARLVLEYVRAPGTTRIASSFTVRSLTLSRGS